MLIDDLLLLSPGEREKLNLLLPELDAAEAYDITDVARFGVQHLFSGMESFVYAKELPNVAPLGPAVWMEFDLAALPDAPFLGIDVRTYGVLLLARDRREEPEEVAHWLRMVGHDPDDAIRWVVPTCVVWRFSDNGEIASRQHFRMLAVRPDGSVEGMYRSTAAKGIPPLSQDLDTAFAFVTIFACLAVTFAHCRNVGTTLHHPTRQQRRFRERHGGPPLVSWRTIDVPGVEHLLRTEGGLEQHGAHKALHLCRAHFKHWAPGTYMGRADAPAMTLYAPLHVRGRDGERSAAHRYRVHPPTTEDRGQTPPRSDDGR
jgi:hypothetical protein